MAQRDHGGGLDAAKARFGGGANDWLDLSTGINPLPYPVGETAPEAWTRLPDRNAFDRLEQAARDFWKIPDQAAVLAAPGASAIIARVPTLAAPGVVDIPAPTYNEHAAAFTGSGWQIGDSGTARVLVHPNNPDGRLWQEGLDAPLMVIDESFCDVTPEATHIARAAAPGTLILKSFGKFWGLAGLRLGFAIGNPALIEKLREALGPWQVSGPALEIGARALEDLAWAEATRARLTRDTARMDGLLTARGARLAGGTTLFRLYEVDSAETWFCRLARAHVLTRVFPYSKTWIRLGLPGPNGWDQLERAL
ncbi:threonine-phosphate decarboxylase [Aliiroseovarius sp.]|uniref:threonine-phosphate decarboxylase n=1 Tax=Aliiroseovarius sp. TaxID=1872442 RepID=UPI002632B255|nr:threonine-phosphate decarboxylase [Aliiroseovarius sp.]